MGLPNKFSYHFYPVGQGLFATGSIRRNGEGKSRFLWVYDCGTSSSANLVENGIQKLDHFAGPRKRIDLLTLSHFDNDHISGVVRLLRDFRIGTLMLPYMPLAQRLLIAFEEGSGNVDDPQADFYANPVAYLLAQGGPGIERILFVLPSGNQGPAGGLGDVNPKEPGPSDEPEIEFDASKPDEWEDVASLISAAGETNARVEFLRPGASIDLAGCLWEFVPYNDDPQTEIEEDFRHLAEVERVNLQSASKMTDRRRALRKLKRVYDRYFGANSEERNVISLFLYSGPIYRSWKICWLTSGMSVPWPEGWPIWPFSVARQVSVVSRCSILYSGDGYLDTPERLQNLVRYLGEHRVQAIGVFQVMHHGAMANWHEGVADAVKPCFSIFSSDPERKKWKHPHAPVLRDFWRCGPVQVDKSSDFTAAGFLLSQNRQTQRTRQR